MHTWSCGSFQRNWTCLMLRLQCFCDGNAAHFGMKCITIFNGCVKGWIESRPSHITSRFYKSCATMCPTVQKRKLYFTLESMQRCQVQSRCLCWISGRIERLAFHCFLFFLVYNDAQIYRKWRPFSTVTSFDFFSTAVICRLFFFSWTCSDWHCQNWEWICLTFHMVA